MLAAEGLDVAYGDFQVLWSAGIRVQEGEVVCLLGPNGAGKSTLMNTLSGLLKPRGGHVEFRGKPIHRLPPHQSLPLPPRPPKAPPPPPPGRRAAGGGHRARPDGAPPLPHDRRAVPRARAQGGAGHRGGDSADQPRGDHDRLHRAERGAGAPAGPPGLRVGERAGHPGRSLGRPPPIKRGEADISWGMTPTKRLRARAEWLTETR